MSREADILYEINFEDLVTKFGKKKTHKAPLIWHKFTPETNHTFWPVNCFLVSDIFFNCVWARCALLKYFIINYEAQVKKSCICGGGPYVVEAPVHWHIVHMPKSRPAYRIVCEWSDKIALWGIY